MANRQGLPHVGRGGAAAVVRSVLKVQNALSIHQINLQKQTCTIIGRGLENIIKYWSFRSGKFKEFATPSEVSFLTFSFDGAFLASYSDQDKSIYIWDVESGQQVSALKSRGPISFSPDSEIVAVVASHNSIYILNTETGETRNLPGCYPFAFSRNGAMFAWCNAHKINVLDIHTDREFSIDAPAVRCIAFSPSGKLIAWGDLEDDLIHIWDIDTGDQRKLRGNDASSRKGILYLGFLSEEYLIVQNLSCTYVCDKRTGREICRLLGGDGELFHAPCESMLALYEHNQGGLVRLVEIHFPDQSMTAYPAICRPKDIILATEEDERFNQEILAAMSLLEKGKTQVAYALLRANQQNAGYERDPRILDLISFCGHKGRRTGIRASSPSGRFEGHSKTVHSVAFSPDGKVIASGGRDNTVRVWDLSSKREIKRINTKIYVNSVSFSHNGKYLAIGEGLVKFGIIRLVDVTSGKIRNFEVHHGLINNIKSVAFSPCDRFLIAGGNMTIFILDVKSCTLVRTIENIAAGDVNSVAFSTDGRYIATGSDFPEIWLFDFSILKPIKKFKVQEAVNSVVFSPNRSLLSAACGNSIYVWDVRTGLKKREFNFDNKVHCMDFSPDGEFIASGVGNIVVILNIEKNSKEGVLNGHAYDVRTVAYSPNGYMLLSGSEAGNESNPLLLWTLDWDYEFPDPADWDEGARPYLEIFLTLHTPYGPDGLSRVGAPQWTEEDFQRLLKELGYRGYGWLRPEGVRRELEKMARERGWKGG